MFFKASGTIIDDITAAYGGPAMYYSATVVHLRLYSEKTTKLHLKVFKQILAQHTQMHLSRMLCIIYQTKQR